MSSMAQRLALTISPTNPTIAAGSYLGFAATAVDSCGNSWDVTNLISWGIASGANGSWSGNIYTAA